MTDDSSEHDREATRVDWVAYRKLMEFQDLGAMKVVAEEALTFARFLKEIPEEQWDDVVELICSHVEDRLRQQGRTEKQISVGMRHARSALTYLVRERPDLLEDEEFFEKLLSDLDTARKRNQGGTKFAYGLTLFLSDACAIYCAPLATKILLGSVLVGFGCILQGQAETPD